MRSKFPCPVAEVPVNEISIAVGYYQRCLGFSLDWHEQDIGLAGVSKGQCRLFLADPEYRKANGNIAPIIIWLNLGSKKETDELYQDWNESDAKLLSAPESKPWGLHEFTASDLDGNLFRVFYDFATPGERHE